MAQLPGIGAQAPIPHRALSTGSGQGDTNSVEGPREGAPTTDLTETPASSSKGPASGITSFARKNAMGLLAAGLGVAGAAGAYALIRTGHRSGAIGLGTVAAGALLLTACGGGQSKPEPTPPPNGGKPSDRSPFSSSDDAILIQLTARPSNEDEIAAMPRGAQRKEAAWDALTNTAKESQKPIVEIADRLKTSGAIEGYEQLISPNMIIVDPADGQDMRVIANKFNVDGVSAIYNNSNSRQILDEDGTLSAPAPEDDDLSPQPLGVAEKNVEGDPIPVNLRAMSDSGWGVKRIGAPTAWDQGARGAGLVYGSIDTGVEWSHKALSNSYRGTGADGADGVDHNYNWMDFDQSYQEPTDADGHGTHTTGNVVGYSQDEDIHLGVSPDSKFIATRALGGNTDGLIRALQFMQAPTKLDGTEARPDLAPDVVGMSWRAGSAREALFQDAIKNLKLAGIEPVVAAGNSGPNNYTVTAPGSLPDAITIGATDAEGKIADFSSRGPNNFPGSSAIKPDFMAPGVETASTYLDNSYARLSGTSMAQPHASGAILTILSKYPDLSHDQLRAVLAEGAIDGGLRGPDDLYGQGEINIPVSLAAAERVTSEPASVPVDERPAA